LKDELQWPDAENRQQLAAVFPGMFSGCIGVADVKEYQVVKNLDPAIRKEEVGVERRNKLLSVMDLWLSYFCMLMFGKE